jgi:hypothetical protein
MYSAGSGKDASMTMNTTVDTDAAEAVEVPLQALRRADALSARASAVGFPPDLDPVVVLELMRKLEQRLRVASLRIAIEGEDINADVLHALARLTAFVEEKLS